MIILLDLRLNTYLVRCIGHYKQMDIVRFAAKLVVSNYDEEIFWADRFFIANTDHMHSMHIIRVMDYGALKSYLGRCDVRSFRQFQ